MPLAALESMVSSEIRAVRPHYSLWLEVRPRRVDVGGRAVLAPAADSARVIGFATAGVVLVSLAIPLLGLYRLFVSPIDAGRTLVEVIAMAGFLPLQAWLVTSATGEHRTRA